MYVHPPVMHIFNTHTQSSSNIFCIKLRQWNFDWENSWTWFTKWLIFIHNIYKCTVYFSLHASKSYLYVCCTEICCGYAVSLSNYLIIRFKLLLLKQFSINVFDLSFFPNLLILLSSIHMYSVLKSDCHVEDCFVLNRWIDGIDDDDDGDDNVVVTAAYSHFFLVEENNKLKHITTSILSRWFQINIGRFMLAESWWMCFSFCLESPADPATCCGYSITIWNGAHEL